MTDEQPNNLVELRARAKDGPVAVVGGEAVLELPADLHIPPDALEVFLETFEGPLDLLLYMIRRRNLDILEVSVAEVTEQYMRYIEMMQVLKLELVGDYLLMAATLASIKSRLLLPRHEEDTGEDDPRAELVRRLQEYEQIKTAAEDIGELPRVERDIFPVQPERPELVKRRANPAVQLKEVLVSLAEVLHRAEMYQHHAVQLEPLSIRERMSDVLARLWRAVGLCALPRVVPRRRRAPGRGGDLPGDHRANPRRVDRLCAERGFRAHLCTGGRLMLSEIDGIETAKVKRIIEGALMAADEPLSVDRLFKLFRRGELDPSEGRNHIREALRELGEDAAGRGYELKRVASGFRFQVRGELSEWISRLWEEKPPRYSRALLETPGAGGLQATGNAWRYRTGTGRGRQPEYRAHAVGARLGAGSGPAGNAGPAEPVRHHPRLSSIIST